jgi:serine/threonine protein kinase
MSLGPGATLGSYRIVGPLGAGGMGEVYRAEDTKLKREVAIKVLPDLVAHDEERMKRFEREAHVLASLNHPHIAAIYGLEQTDGAIALVLELVEGQTLSERIDAGRIPIEEALRVARQVAQALEAAHDKGIVHRDLKPANVKVTSEGDVKVLDFGLAKEIREDAPESSISRSPTMARPTAAGIILGTAGYMSPEQARGRNVDKRADIWAFGVLLYEMLSGSRLFEGETVSDTLAAVLTREPDWSRLPKDTPPSVHRLLKRLLERDPKRRLRDIGDAIADLEGGPAAEASVPVPSRTRPRWVAVSLIAAILTGFLGYEAARRREEAPRLSFRRLTFRRGSVPEARFAPDGATAFFSGSWEGQPLQLFSSRLDFPESSPMDLPPGYLAGVAVGEIALIQSNGTLSRAPLGVGAPRDVLAGIKFADLSADGSKFAIVRRVGGRDRLEFPPGTTLYETVGDIFFPRISPSQDRVAFVDRPQSGYTSGYVRAVDLAGKILASSERYGSTDGIAWRVENEVWYSSSLGGEESVVRALSMSGGSREVLRGAGSYVLRDVSQDGRVLLAQEKQSFETAGLAPGETKERDLSWLDRTYVEDITPDGRTIVFHEGGTGGFQISKTRQGAAFLRGTNGSAPVRLAMGQPLALSPDAKWALVFTARDPPKVELFPTGAGEPRTLPAGTIQQYFDAWWFPEGTRVVIAGNEAGRARRLFLQDTAAGDPRPLTPEGVWTEENAISPDGKWIAAGADGHVMSLYPVEGGDPRPIPGLSPEEYVLRWTADGRHVFVGERFLRKLPATIFRVDIASGRREAWKELMPSDPAGVAGLAWICLTPDGESYAYTYSRTLSDLYLVEGLR